MHRRSGRLVGVVAVGVGCVGILGFADMAGAQDLGCDQVVYDPAHQLADIAAVQTAADSLSGRHQLVVRVRAEPNLDGTVDSREVQLERACSSWATNGVRLDNLLVVIVAPTERQTGIYYGSSVAPVLDDRWNAIQTEQMNPLFKVGDFSTGLALGLNEIGAALDGAVVAAAAPRPGSAVQPTLLPRAALQPVYNQPVVGGGEFPASGGGSGDDGPGAGFGAFFGILTVGAIGVAVFKAASSGGAGGSSAPRRRISFGEAWRNAASGTSAGSMFDTSHHDSPHDSSSSGGSPGGSTGGSTGGPSDTGGGGGSTSW